jgi:tetratricopeptide (TPR) repeat protein
MSAGGSLDLTPEQEARLERLGLEFQADFLGRACARRPGNFEALSDLASILTRLGRVEEGLAADQELVRLAPKEPVVHYNLACSLALLDRVDAALDALERAIALGYRDLDHLEEDGDLERVRASPRYRSLLVRLRAKGKR